jgi:hypothetical protein
MQIIGVWSVANKRTNYFVLSNFIFLVKISVMNIGR